MKCPIKASTQKKLALKVKGASDFKDTHADDLLTPVTQWNHIFFVICIAGFFLDPLYFFLPTTSNDQAACRQIDMGLGILVTFLRTVADSFTRDPKPLVSPPIPPCERKWVGFKSLGGVLTTGSDSTLLIFSLMAGAASVFFLLDIKGQVLI
ncbi:hypothetical protein ACFX2A_015148 [Malus domestica]